METAPGAQEAVASTGEAPQAAYVEAALKRRLEEHPREDAWVALEYVLECYRPSGFFITEEYAVKLAYRMARVKL